MTENKNRTRRINWTEGMVFTETTTNHHTGLPEADTNSGTWGWTADLEAWDAEAEDWLLIARDGFTDADGDPETEAPYAAVEARILAAAGINRDSVDVVTPW